MEVFIVWIEDAYDSRDFFGCFSTEERAQEWVNNNLDAQDKKYAYIEHHYVD